MGPGVDGSSSAGGPTAPGAAKAGDPRARMVAGAVQLLATHGLQGTSFSEVLALTGAPRGSVYHYFPQGKDQLVGAAVELAGRHALELLDQQAGADPVELTEFFLSMWRAVLARGQFRVGCAVLAVTVATDSPDLLTHVAGVFRAWRRRLGELFEQGGVAAVPAQRFAALVIAASEGGVVMSRAEQSFEPFDLVAEQLVAQAHALAGGPPLPPDAT